jgi:hypothetical protein
LKVFCQLWARVASLVLSAVSPVSPVSLASDAIA